MTPESWWRPVWRFIFALAFAGSLLCAELRHIDLPGWVVVPAFVLALPAQELSGSAIAALYRAILRRWMRRDFPRAVASISSRPSPRRILGP